MSHKWTKEEKRMVIEHYLEPEGPEMLAEAIDIPVSLVKARAADLGVAGRNQRKYETRKEKYRNPASLPVAELRTGKCPGKRLGCGKILWREPVLSTEGFSVAGVFDLVCVAGHRFPIPNAE